MWNNLVLVLVGVVLGVESHVSLTFPPARQFPIDFLNTFWTKQPCGMPRGQIKTSLVAGKAFNATWHLGYAHQGGYRIELLDQNENKVMDLTPTNDDFYQGQHTAQWHYIDIPENTSCSNCVLRLLRQVPEFSPTFQFISCADVDIVGRHSYVESCSGHGHVLGGGRCTCYARYWGDKCQYQDECDTDLDCNGVGRCINLGGSALPRKQCFCPETHYGGRCTYHNPPNMPRPNNLNLKKHVKVKLDERFTMYFKILFGSSQSQDEVEFVVQINGTTYGALGWRPTALTPICKSWPFYPNSKYVNRISKRSPADTFTITKAIDQSHDFSQHSPTTRPYENYVLSSNANTGSARTVSSSSGHSQPQIYETFDNRHSQNQYNSENVQVVQLSQPQTQRPQRLQNTVKVTSTRFQSEIPRPQPQPQSQPQQSQRQRQSEPLAQPQNVVISQPTAQPPIGSEWAAQDPFTPMDCSDIIIGTARGSYHRFRDTYSRGRHTPLPDSIWGGRDDLTGAVGWEENGLTTLAFRRRMDSSDGPDHPIRGDMQVIWARGQEPGELVPMPQHQLVPGNPTVSHFYTRDELKYHGLGSQRGSLFIDFDAVRKEFLSGSYSQ